LAYDDLRDWIKTLEKHGELRRIREEVSPELEITEITDRVTKARGGKTRPAARRCSLKT
jgi:4-hydroxy-3-polyprenylbenzoate decarboxylase